MKTKNSKWIFFILVGFAGLITSCATCNLWSQKLPATERFTLVLDDEAVLDNETGLVWERSPITETKTWVLAIKHCYGRNISDRKGWRLPTVEELASLLDPTQSDPALPPDHPFSFTPQTYWSATTNAEDTNGAWNVNFINGAVGRSVKSAIHHVWCVRSGYGYDAFLGREQIISKLCEDCVRITELDFTISPGHLTEKTVSCETDEVVTGGGVRTVDDPKLFIWHDGPSLNGKGWKISISNYGTASRSVKAYAICVKAE